MDKNELLTAIRCCREGQCEKCPLQLEICDELCIPAEELPSELLDLIETVLELN